MKKLLNINGQNKDCIVYGSKYLEKFENEFQTLNWINNTLFNLCKDDLAFNLRVPLAFTVDYKGIKGIITTIPNISSESEFPEVIHGLNKNLEYIESEKMNLL